MAKKAKLNLWVSNHPFDRISDQVEFFVCSARANGYEVSVSSRLERSCLNVMIENIRTMPAYTQVNDFCRSHLKRVGVILTEHIDFINNSILFHGKDLEEDHPYLAPRKERLHFLICLSEVTSMYFTLGDLPEMVRFGEWLHGARLLRLPYPSIEPSQRRQSLTSRYDNAEYDLTFTGMMTDYRTDILAEIRRSYKVLAPERAATERLFSRNRRDALILAGAISLNIPQECTWKWISMMRVLAALRCGRATVSISAREPAHLAKYYATISTNDIAEQLDVYVRGYTSYAKEYLERYNDFTRSSDNFKFPHELIDSWATLEL